MDVNNPLKMVSIGIDPYPDVLSPFRWMICLGFPPVLHWPCRCTSKSLCCPSLGKRTDRELWVNFGVNIWRCNVHRWLRKATATQSSLQDRVFLQAWVHLHLPHENAITKRKKMKGPDFRDSILVFRGVTSKKGKNTDKHALLQSSHLNFWWKSASSLDY